MDKQLKATVTNDPSVKDNGMSEIYQSQTTKQALLRRDSKTAFTRITNFVLCRDFLVDTYSFAKVNKDFGIYGFQFKGSEQQPDWTGCYIQMKFESAKSRTRFMENIEVVREIERNNKYAQTQILDINGSEGVVVIGDVKWLQNCLSFSLYSLLLRVACYDLDLTKGDWIKNFGTHKDGDGNTASDAKYIASCPRKTLDKVFKDLSLIATKEFCGFDPASVSVSTIHHNSGFISVFGHHSEISPSTVKTNAHWQEMKKRGLESKVA